MKAEISEASKNPQDLLLEAIHSAGYSGALANPLLAQESATNRLNGTILEEFVAVSRESDNYTHKYLMIVICYLLPLFKLGYFMKHQENYTAPRMVLSASGVEHEELLSIAEPLLSDLPSVPHLKEPKSVYTGGDYRCQSESGVCIVNRKFKLLLL